MGDEEDVPVVHRIRVPGVHGPVDDWFVIPDWVHERAHVEGVAHVHFEEEVRRG